MKIKFASDNHNDVDDDGSDNRCVEDGACGCDGEGIEEENGDDDGDDVKSNIYLFFVESKEMEACTTSWPSISQMAAARVANAAGDLASPGWLISVALQHIVILALVVARADDL